MDVIKRISTRLLLILIFTPSLFLFAQTEVKFGDKKIKIPGSEICSYTINQNHHLAKDYLDLKNGQLYYTVVEYDNGIPVHIEITECKMTDMDKSSCSLASADQKSTYTPGEIYVIYLYTKKDEVNISTTIYDSPNGTATVQNSSVGRIHFHDWAKAESFFDANFK